MPPILDTISLVKGNRDGHTFCGQRNYEVEIDPEKLYTMFPTFPPDVTMDKTNIDRFQPTLIDWIGWSQILSLELYKLNPLVQVEYPVENEPKITLNGDFFKEL